MDADLSGLRRIVAAWLAGYLAERLGEIAPSSTNTMSWRKAQSVDLFLAMDADLDDKFRHFLRHPSRLHMKLGVLRRINQLSSDSRGVVRTLAPGCNDG